MAELKLRNSDKVAVVDDEDYERLSAYKWYVTPNGSVHRCYVDLYRTRNVSLANEVMRQFGVIFDHTDINSLNNCKSNLRIATFQQNSFNKKKFKNKTSKYKGVSFHKRDKVWGAHICINRNLIYLGTFKCEIEAAKAYNKKATELFKEFACLNTFD